MKNILIISATLNSNLDLANKLNSLLNDENVKSKVIDLECFGLPIYHASNSDQNTEKYSKQIKELTDCLVQADGLIICAPEYNGSIPPIVNNAIAWVSVSTDYWRDGFNNKIGLVATSSGGAAIKYNTAMKNQLEHLGMIVLPRYISVTSNNPLNETSTKKILKQFINLI